MKLGRSIHERHRTLMANVARAQLLASLAVLALLLFPAVGMAAGRDRTDLLELPAPPSVRPLTGFLPSRDFLAIENFAGPGETTHGNCMGIVGLALVHLENKGQPGWQPLGPLSEKIKQQRDATGPRVDNRLGTPGDRFLKNVAILAKQNYNETRSGLTHHTNEDMPSGSVASQVGAELLRTKKPQYVILLGGGIPHAVVAYDTFVRKDKQQNDQLFLRIGDPNHPKYDSLYLKYDKSKNKNQWQIVVYDDKKKQWSVPKDYQTAGYNDVAVHGRAEGDKWEFEPLRGPDNYRKILELAQDGNKNIGDIAKATNLQLDAVPAPPSKAVTRPPSKPETDFEAKKEALKAEMRAHVQRYKMKQGEDIPAEDIEKERKWVKDWNAKGRDLARRWKELTGKEEMSDQDLRDVGLK